MPRWLVELEKKLDAADFLEADDDGTEMERIQSSPFLPIGLFSMGSFNLSSLFALELYYPFPFLTFLVHTYTVIFNRRFVSLFKFPFGTRRKHWLKDLLEHLPVLSKSP